MNDQKTNYEVSDYQKSERDFAFIVNKNVSSQDLINAISHIDQNLISNIKVFDVYEGDNIPENQKSIAINVTIQSFEKTLNDSDLEKINKLIIQTVENKMIWINGLVTFEKRRVGRSTAVKIITPPIVGVPFFFM